MRCSCFTRRRDVGDPDRVRGAERDDKLAGVVGNGSHSVARTCALARGRALERGGGAALVVERPAAASDRLAPTRRATRRAARQRPRPDAELVYGEVSFLNLPSHHSITSWAPGEQLRRDFEAKCVAKRRFPSSPPACLSLRTRQVPQLPRSALASFKGVVSKPSTYHP
jgi:hypothetical protein